MSQSTKTPADNNCIPLYTDLVIKLKQLVLLVHEAIARLGQSYICPFYESGLSGERSKISRATQELGISILLLDTVRKSTDVLASTPNTLK